MQPLHALLFAPLAAALALSPSTSSPVDSPLVARQEATAPVAAGVANFTFNELWDLQKRFLDNFIYPADIKQAQSINSTLLAENVQGRIDITRTFNGRELNTEYLFGLFANLATENPGAISLLGVPMSYEVLHFAANQNVASALTRFQFNFTALNLVVPVEIDTWNAFNAQGEIIQYDATFKYWQWTVDYLLQKAGQRYGAKSTQATITTLTQAIAKSICGTSQQHCTGTNAQYASAEECFGFLTGKIRFGHSYELGRNTLLCRMVHQNMIPFRPDVHCSHIGKTGGGYCDDDKTYEETVMENYFTNSPFVPYGYVGRGPIAANDGIITN
ncbi:MAG: hypothetical protein Q9208_006752 [Pyrenodesmia sp. 3 TL-2023]